MRERDQLPYGSQSGLRKRRGTLFVDDQPHAASIAKVRTSTPLDFAGKRA
jgi:hypothetical protein